MPAPKAPRAPSGKKGSQRPGAHDKGKGNTKSAVTTALRRYNMLSQPVTNQLTIDDLATRMMYMMEEEVARSDLHKVIHDDLIFDKINAAVARHWYSTMSSRAYLLQEEQAAIDKLLATHVATMKVLRSAVPLQRVQQMIVACRQEEDTARRKHMFLEDRMFRDFFAALRVEIHADAERRRKEAAMRQHMVRPPARPTDDTDEADEGAVAAAHALSCVKLPSGCPFIHSRHCPFHAAAWVDRTSYCEQHDKNKYPRLKQPLVLEQRSYEELLRKKTEAAAQVNFRMFGQTSGLSRPTSASSARR